MGCSIDAVLGPDLLPQICSWLTHRDWSSLSRTSQALRAAVDAVRAALLAVGPRSFGRLEFSPREGSATIGRHVLAGATRLQHLGLRGIGGIDDRQLRSLAVLRTLRTLDLASTEVTSRGMPALWALQALESLDLTYASMVSYAAVLDLRRECPNLRLIRRQPEWLDGKIEGLSSMLGIAHTYYPCGAFHWEGERSVDGERVEGWIAQLRDHGDYLEHRLIFAPTRWAWMRIWNGRFGMLLRPLVPASEEASGCDDCHGLPASASACASAPRQLMMVTSRQGPEPPQSFPQQLLADGALVSTVQGVDVHVPPGSTLNLAGGLVASNVQVSPLDPGCTAPPPELQARLRAYCEQRLNTASGEPGHLERREFEAGALISIRSRVGGGNLIDVTNPMGDRRVASRFARVVDDLVADRLDVSGFETYSS